MKSTWGFPHDAGSCFTASTLHESWRRTLAALVSEGLLGEEQSRQGQLMKSSGRSILPPIITSVHTTKMGAISPSPSPNINRPLNPPPTPPINQSRVRTHRTQEKHCERKTLRTLSKMIDCPLGCGHLILRQWEFQHRTFDCPKRPALCPRGCSAKVAADEVAAHSLTCGRRRIR